MITERKKPSKKNAAAPPCVMFPYAINDFRNNSQYVRPESIAGWRWEFLRRNAEYQARYDACRDRVPTEHDVTEMLLRFGVRILCDPRANYLQASVGFASPGGAVVHAGTSERIAVHRLKFAERELARGVPAIRILHTILHADIGRYAPSTAQVFIDTTIPLAPQFASAKHMIEADRKFKKSAPAVAKMRAKEWLDYLRVLDGWAAKASYNEIAGAVYPHTPNAYPDYAGRKATETALATAQRLTATLGTSGFAMR